MTVEAWRRLVNDRLISVVAGTDQLDAPHLVVVSEPSGGVATYFGPYPDVTTALRDADRLRDELVHGGHDVSITVGVARLHGPTPAADG